MAASKEGKISKIIRTISVIWDYFTVATLVFFGITFLSPVKTIPYAIIVFSFGALFLILTTWKYFVGPKLKRDSKRKIARKRMLGFFYKLVKFVIIVLPLLTLNPNWTVDMEHPQLTTVLSLTWLGITIILEIIMFFLRRLVKKIKTAINKDEK